MNAIQQFVPSEVVKTVAAFLEFCYIARRNIITEESLEQLNSALKRFHQSRKVFIGTVREDGPSAFSLPRQHSMVHYYDNIKNFGSPNGLCSSITESKHIAAVKRPWRRSNKHMALAQILKTNERLNKMAAARVDFTARGMLTDSCLGRAIIDSLISEDASDSDDDINPQVLDSDKSILDDEDVLDDDILDDDILDDDVLDDDILDNDILDDDILDDDILNLDVLDYEAGILDNDDILGSLGGDSTPNPSNPPPPADEEDDECGPVESGPLMNEVRFVGRKGMLILHPSRVYELTAIHSIQKGIPHLASRPWCQDRSTQPPRTHPPFPLLSTQSLNTHRPRPSDPWRMPDDMGT
jgi:hypothetical protein